MFDPKNFEVLFRGRDRFNGTRTDQRIAKSNGRLYLFDWSGGAPDRTDDGPLCLDVVGGEIVLEPSSIGGSLVCTLPCIAERTNSKCYVGVSISTALALSRFDGEQIGDKPGGLFSVFIETPGGLRWKPDHVETVIVGGGA